MTQAFEAALEQANIQIWKDFYDSCTSEKCERAKSVFRGIIERLYGDHNYDYWKKKMVLKSYFSCFSKAHGGSVISTRSFLMASLPEGPSKIKIGSKEYDCASQIDTYELMCVFMKHGQQAADLLHKLHTFKNECDPIPILLTNKSFTELFTIFGPEYIISFLFLLQRQLEIEKEKEIDGKETIYQEANCNTIRLWREMKKHAAEEVAKQELEALESIMPVSISEEAAQLELEAREKAREEKLLQEKLEIEEDERLRQLFANNLNAAAVFYSEIVSEIGFLMRDYVENCNYESKNAAVNLFNLAEQEYSLSLSNRTHHVRCYSAEDIMTLEKSLPIPIPTNRIPFDYASIERNSALVKLNRDYEAYLLDKATTQNQRKI